MPRRPRTPASPPALTVPAGLAIIQQIPAPEDAPAATRIVSLLRTNRTAAESMDEIRQSLGGTMADAVENHGLHKKAFGWVKQLDRMSPEKISDLLGHFLFYVQARANNAPSILDRALSAQRLPTGEATAETETTAESAAPAPRQRGNITPFPAMQAAE
jgi:hypothetical protein